jgi:hypothetical protein
MKFILSLTLAIASSFNAIAQSISTETHPIMKVTDGLYHLFYDSSTAKSTIVEFDKFIVLVEVPVKNIGALWRYQ